MAVAERIDGDAAGEVEIAIAAGFDQPDALALLESQRGARKGLVKRRTAHYLSLRAPHPGRPATARPEPPWPRGKIKKAAHAAAFEPISRFSAMKSTKRSASKPCEAMRLHQDGSRHDWLSTAPLDLVVTLDDATRAIYSAFLIEEEGTASSFQGLLETFAAKGLASSLYSDRGSHYFVTPKAGGAVDKIRSTQVGRALERLGIDHIPAYSPEAGAARSGCSAPCRAGCRASWRWLELHDVEAANRFIAREHICRTTMPASPGRLRSTTAPSSLSGRNLMTAFPGLSAGKLGKTGKTNSGCLTNSCHGVSR